LSIVIEKSTNNVKFLNFFFLNFEIGFLLLYLYIQCPLLIFHCPSSILICFGVYWPPTYSVEGMKKIFWRRRSWTTSCGGSWRRSPASRCRGPGADWTTTQTAEWVVRQPIQLHGAGLSSQQDSCYPAYLGSLQQVAPYMARQHGLEVAMGGEVFWGEEADPGTRWAALLDSSQLDGKELRSA
jgi:hypothetical protein